MSPLREPPSYSSSSGSGSLSSSEEGKYSPSSRSTAHSGATPRLLKISEAYSLAKLVAMVAMASNQTCIDSRVEVVTRPLRRIELFRIRSKWSLKNRPSRTYILTCVSCHFPGDQLALATVHFQHAGVQLLRVSVELAAAWCVHQASCWAEMMAMMTNQCKQLLSQLVDPIQLL